MLTSRGAVLVTLVGVLLVLLAFPSQPAHAASAFTIKVSVAEPGAPSFTYAIAGCSTNRTSGTSGNTYTVSMSSNCVYTISSGAGNATLRDRLTSGYATTVSETSCTGATCSPIIIAANVEELLGLSSNCNGPAVSPASPTSDSWFNYGTVLSVSCDGAWGRSNGMGVRATSWNWDGGAANLVATTGTFGSPKTMTSHHTFNVNTVVQYQLTLDQGATKALASVTSPTITSDKYWYDSGTLVTYQGNGVFGRANGFGNRSGSWYLDAGQPTALSTATAFTVTATMASPHTIHVLLKPQWQVNLDASSAPFLKSLTAPTVAGDNYWYDTGSVVTLVLDGTGPRSGGVGSRLVSYSVNGGPSVAVNTTGTVTLLNAVSITGKELVTGTLVTQYQLSLDAGAVSSLASVTAPSIPGDNYWYDSGTHVTYAASGVFSRANGAGMRISSWWLDSSPPTTVLTGGFITASIYMSGPHSIHTLTRAQYQVALVGNYGVSSGTSATIGGDNYWYDSGTVVTMSLQGEFGRAAGTGWRMTSYSVNTGPPIPTAGGGNFTVLNAMPLTSPQTIHVQAVKQYQVSFDQTLATSLNYITSPTVPGDSYWYDSGSAVTLSVHGVWGRTANQGYRLSSYSIDGAPAVSVGSSGTIVILNLAGITGPQLITSSAATQYLLSVEGGPRSTYSVTPPIAGDTGWYDSGTTLSVSTNGTYDSGAGVRQRISGWTIDNGPSNPAGVGPVVITPAIVMDAPHLVSFQSVVQYLVTVVVKDSGATNILTPASLTLTVNGGDMTTTSGAIWVDGGSRVGVMTVFWHRLDVAPSQPAEYDITSPFTIAVDARVYDATIMVEDTLGVAVGGADASITLANGTNIHASSAGDGIILVKEIPLGTYRATISYLGLSTTLSGDASTAGSVVAHLPLGWSVILLLVVVIVLGVAVFLFVRRRGLRRPRAGGSSWVP